MAGGLNADGNHTEHHWLGRANLGKTQNVQQKNDSLTYCWIYHCLCGQKTLSHLALSERGKRSPTYCVSEEGMTALIAYAGDAHAVVPLTDDVATIENLLGALDPGMMPVLGSNPGHALELAAELFSNANMNEGRVLMITDGIDRISSVSSHRNPAYPISIIGVGSYDGGPILNRPPNLVAFY